MRQDGLRGLGATRMLSSSTLMVRSSRRCSEAELQNWPTRARVDCQRRWTSGPRVAGSSSCRSARVRSVQTGVQRLDECRVPCAASDIAALGVEAELSVLPTSSAEIGYVHSDGCWKTLDWTLSVPSSDLGPGCSSCRRCRPTGCFAPWSGPPSPATILEKPGVPFGAGMGRSRTLRSRVGFNDWLKISRPSSSDAVRAHLVERLRSCCVYSYLDTTRAAVDVAWKAGRRRRVPCSPARPGDRCTTVASRQRRTRGRRSARHIRPTRRSSGGALGRSPSRSFGAVPRRIDRALRSRPGCSSGSTR